MVLASTKKQSDDEENVLVVISENNAPNIHNILKTLLFRERGYLVATESGLKVIVEEFKCVQAVAYLKAELFSFYYIKPGHDVQIKINLQLLCDCLSLFGSGQHSKPSVKLTYAGEGESVRMILEDEQGCVTDCSIKTLDSPDEEDIMDMDFEPENTLSKIIMKSEALRETFSELDATSDVLEISVHPKAPNLRFTTRGSCGEIHHDFVESSSCVEKFTCSAKHSNKYRITLLKPTARVLQLATKISLRTDTRGFLSWQYMLDFDNIGSCCFVEFTCSPEQEYPDD